MDGSPRSVSLVVVDSRAPREQDPVILGVTAPRAVASPWWPEVPSIVEVFGSLVVVRLLEVERRDDWWHVTYLAELPTTFTGEGTKPDDTDFDDLELSPWAGSTPEAGDQRMPWAEIGGAVDALRWAERQLRDLGQVLTTRPIQHKTWNLSSLWELKHEGGTVWLKTLAPFGRHETAVLDLLSGLTVPTLLANNDNRMLIDSMPGVDGFGATVAEHIEIVDALVDIQLAAIPLVDEALSRAIPDLRVGPMTDGLVNFVERQAQNVPSLRKIAAEAPARLAELHNCGLPTTIVHGDAHPGNARVGCGRPIIFDWADSFVGSPMWDLSRVLGDDDPNQRRVRTHWLNRWHEVPGANPERAAELMWALAPLRAAFVYQGFVNAIETSERIYHQDDVSQQLCLARERW